MQHFVTRPRTIAPLALCMLLGILLGAALLAASPSVSPATAPAPMNHGTVRGQIKISQGLELQKPDLAHVVVYLASDPALDAVAPATQPATVAQRNKQFVPGFLVVPSGTTVEFPNWDHFDHNVFSKSKAAPAFDLDRYPYGSSKSRVFIKTGVVQIFCNIHPEMRAIIFVTPNVYFTRADATGHFILNGVPPGHYELAAWQERCGEKLQPISVAGPDTPTDVEITLEESRQSIMTNVPPRRGGYGGVERGLGVKRERLDLPVVEDVHPAPCCAAPADTRPAGR